MSYESEILIINNIVNIVKFLSGTNLYIIITYRFGSILRYPVYIYLE